MNLRIAAVLLFTGVAALADPTTAAQPAAGAASAGQQACLQPGTPPRGGSKAQPGGSTAAGVVMLPLPWAMACPDAAAAAPKPAAAVESEADASQRRALQMERHARQLALSEQLHRVAGGLAVLALALCLVAVVQARLHGLRFGSHWGGFGGTGTGWQFAPAAVSLMTAALLFLLALLLTMGAMKAVEHPAPAAGAASAKS